MAAYASSVTLPTDLPAPWIVQILLALTKEHAASDCRIAFAGCAARLAGRSCSAAPSSMIQRSAEESSLAASRAKTSAIRWRRPFGPTNKPRQQPSLTRSVRLFLSRIGPPTLPPPTGRCSLSEPWSHLEIRREEKTRARKRYLWPEAAPLDQLCRVLKHRQQAFDDRRRAAALRSRNANCLDRPWRAAHHEFKGMVSGEGQNASATACAAERAKPVQCVAA